MTKIKNEIFKGKKLTFTKHYNYISKDFPASPNIKGYINGKYYGSGFTKQRILRSMKNDIRINSKRKKKIK